MAFLEQSAHVIRALGQTVCVRTRLACQDLKLVQFWTTCLRARTRHRQAPRASYRPRPSKSRRRPRPPEDAKLKAAFEGGQITDLKTLSVNKLQTLAKQSGWQGHYKICARRWSCLSISCIQGSTSLISPTAYWVSR